MTITERIMKAFVAHCIALMPSTSSLVCLAYRHKIQRYVEMER